MACNCTKCSSTCSCSDTALTNAYTYTDCSVGSKMCDDIQRAEGVSYCGTAFQIGAANALLQLSEAEKKKGVLEKGWIHITNAMGGPLGDGRCDNPNIRNDNPLSCALPWATSLAAEQTSKLWGAAAQKTATEHKCKST